jgi:hypothetical protein
MRKEPIVTTIAFLLAAGLFVPAPAFQVRELAWADLVKKVEFEDPFEALAPDQLLDLSLVARARQQEASGREIGEEAGKRWEAATMRLEKAATKNLYLVDGSADIDMGYSLQASQVEPYKTH